MIYRILIGDAMANAFLQYRGCSIGKSISESGQEQVIKNIYDKAEKKVGIDHVDDFLVLPSDVAVAPDPYSIWEFFRIVR